MAFPSREDATQVYIPESSFSRSEISMRLGTVMLIRSECTTGVPSLYQDITGSGLPKYRKIMFEESMSRVLYGLQNTVRDVLEGKSAK